jgi:hypothetical protein
MAESDPEKKSTTAGSPTVETQLADSAERVRTTAKWLVGTFGAIAGALVAGLQISDIGELTGTNRVIATVGVLVALAAVLLIVTLASIVLARGRVALSDLADESDHGRKRRLVAELNRSPALYAPYRTVSEFANAVSSQWIKQATSWLTKETTTDAGARSEAEREFAETKKILPGLNRIDARLMATARAEDVKLTFDRVRLWIAALGVVAALGAGTFAYVNTVPDQEEEAPPALAQRPVAAIADLTEGGQEKFEGALGSSCDFDHVPVMVLSSSDDGWEVVSLAGRGCEASRVMVSPDDGEVYSEEPEDLDIPES